MPFKLMTVVGGRPQFIKAAVISREIELRDTLLETIVHTGQHFDANMSQIFFDELGIPAPSVNLGVSGGSHAQMTGRMLVELEKTMQSENPDMVLVYGDMNSTLAGALAAVKLGIPICHVEAGGRTRHLSNPEEANRVCVDHVSQVDCAVTQLQYNNLVTEGLVQRSVFTGDPMLDAFEHFRKISPHVSEIELETVEGKRAKAPNKYIYLTCHRQENTDRAKLRELFFACKDLAMPIVYPVHPRLKTLVPEIASEVRCSNVLFTRPVGYLESIALTVGSEAVITDSGGLSREAFFSGKKCVTLMDFVVIPEIMVDGRNTLSFMERESIIEALNTPQHIDLNYQPFGDGHSACRIVDAMEAYLEGAKE